MAINWFKYASPATFYPLAGRMLPWFVWTTVVLMAVGVYMGLFLAPTDYKQGEAYRIMFIHVPAAWMSMWLYVVMAVYAAIGLIYKTRLSSMMAAATAPTGALFAFAALWTGAFWGRPMWGAWWVWDARLTSELILLFLYLGVMALRSAIDEPGRADRASGLLALVGVVNVPIIYFSVKWWNTLHQGASLKFSGSAMAPSMLWPMLVLTFAFWSYSFVTILLRVRCEILERERHADWVIDLLDNGPSGNRGR
ncbi:MAG: heme ABC transporter permease [Nitrospirota bacterium]|nr:heme ABC transporter permease [Nitrospirota bacterium]